MTALEQRIRLFTHEFGHAVVTHALGFVNTGIKIEIVTAGNPPIEFGNGSATIQLCESGVSDVKVIPATENIGTLCWGSRPKPQVGQIWGLHSR
jgi:hypothetical protein